MIVQGTYLNPPTGTAGTPAARSRTRSYVMNKDGDVLTGSDAERVMEQQREQVRQAAIKSLLTQGGIALVVVGGLAAGFGWLVAGRVLAPLHRVTDTARRIAAAPAAGRGLHERIALGGPHDEVKELADTFDTMVERLDHSFDGQRRFVANASHELRTPLTLSRALVEVAMHRRTASADVKELGESLLDDQRPPRAADRRPADARRLGEAADRRLPGQPRRRRQPRRRPADPRSGGGRRRPDPRPRRRARAAATRCCSNASCTTWSRTASATTSA